MSKRSYTHIQTILPEIKEMLAGGKVIEKSKHFSALPEIVRSTTC